MQPAGVVDSRAANPWSLLKQGNVASQGGAPTLPPQLEDQVQGRPAQIVEGSCESSYYKSQKRQEFCDGQQHTLS